MARSHLTLAALATSAVPGLDVAAAQAFSSGTTHDFDAALITGTDGRHWIIRVPRTQRAEQQQSADLEALRALSVGVRARLPFAVPTFAGQVRVGPTRAIVTEFVYGSKVPLSAYGAGPDGLAASVGAAIAALHALPTSVVADVGLPMLTASECLRSCVTVIDRAAATGLVPAGLLGRWERAIEDTVLWQFQPTVANPALSAEAILSQDDKVTGILGWQELRVGDPARDLQWILGSRHEDVIASAFDAYAAVSGGRDRLVRQRATLYAELEVARWLLHGTESRSTEIVDDAVGMLASLAEALETDLMSPIGAPAPAAMDDDIEQFFAKNRFAV